MREGANSQQLSREEIREFFYAEGLVYFDETPCPAFSLEDDLDEDRWALFVGGPRFQTTWLQPSPCATYT